MDFKVASLILKLWEIYGIGQIGFSRYTAQPKAHFVLQGKAMTLNANLREILCMFIVAKSFESVHSET